MHFNPNAIDVDGAAEFLRCSKTSVYTGVKNGTLPAHRVGKLLRFFQAELHEATARDSWARSSASAAAMKRRLR